MFLAAVSREAGVVAKTIVDHAELPAALLAFILKLYVVAGRRDVAAKEVLFGARTASAAYDDSGSVDFLLSSV